MKLRYIAAIACLGLTTMPLAAEHAHEMNHGAAERSAIVDATGTINRIDAETGVINVTHAPIPALGWPAMTMDFTLAEKAHSAGLKVGQAVKFKIKKVGQTDYVVTEIVPQ